MCWDLLSWQVVIFWYDIVDIVAADDQVMQGARALVAVVSISVTVNILVSAWKELVLWVPDPYAYWPELFITVPADGPMVLGHQQAQFW